MAESMSPITLATSISYYYMRPNATVIYAANELIPKGNLYNFPVRCGNYAISFVIVQM
jgi:hypothetical protein